MNSLLFLGLSSVLMILGAVRNNSKLQSVLKKHSGKTNVLPQAISVLILTAQLSELIKVIDHVSIVNITGSLFLLAILVATKSGTEGELG